MTDTLGIDWEADLNEQIGDLSYEITIGSQTLDCVASAERRSLDITAESADNVYERTVRLVRSGLTSIPSNRTVATINSVKYSIENVSDLREQGAVVLELQRMDGGDHGDV